MKPLRVLVLVEKGLLPPEDPEAVSAEELDRCQAEYDVCATLREMGHVVRAIEIEDDLTPVKQSAAEARPEVVFNLLEGIRGNPVFDQHIVSYLELLELPYTGCNPRGLTLARDKALTKKIMAYYRIHAPAFAVFPRRRRVVRPKKLAFPLLVKSLTVEGSIGIAQASVVHNDEQLRERVQFIHDSLETSAIAEQYIEGREIYVGVVGNARLQVFPAWELMLDSLPEGTPRIATRRMKFDRAFQAKHHITTSKAEGLPDGMEKALPHLCKRIYRLLGLSGYARLDFRLTPAGELYLLEANPNPHIAEGEDFAQSAEAAGLGYEALLQEILRLGMTYRPEAMV